MSDLSPRVSECLGCGSAGVLILFAFCRKIFVGGVAWETTEGKIYMFYLLDLVAWI